MENVTRIKIIDKNKKYLINLPNKIKKIKHLKKYLKQKLTLKSNFALFLKMGENDLYELLDFSGICVVRDSETILIFDENNNLKKEKKKRNNKIVKKIETVNMEKLNLSAKKRFKGKHVRFEDKKTDEESANSSDSIEQALIDFEKKKLPTSKEQFFAPRFLKNRKITKKTKITEKKLNGKPIESNNLKKGDKIAFKKLILNESTWQPSLSQYIECVVEAIENEKIIYKLINHKNKNEDIFGEISMKEMQQIILINFI
ncbi:hypothetical protein MHBO_001636 [Bonamia ostreae]|uniref:Coilin n=1 Tax=Bonamia ostreae TaxID=126728 RepID=A0ABV2AK87_9EUKA